jgi:hypothetical protein
MKNPDVRDVFLEPVLNKTAWKDLNIVRFSD